jgi:hypothetical protein
MTNTTYVRYGDNPSVEGPFASPEAADAYVYDIGCDDSDYRLLDATELKADDEIIAPHINFINVRIQINNLYDSTDAREVLRKALMAFNEENSTGASLYLAEDRD